MLQPAPDPSLPESPGEGTPDPSRGLLVETDPGAGADDHLTGFLDSSFDQCFAMKSGQFPGKTQRALLGRGEFPDAGAIVVSVSAFGLKGGVAKVRFGPFWRRPGQIADPSAYEAIVRALIGHYAVDRGQMLTITPRPSPDHSAGEMACLERLGFQRRPNAGSIRYCVDLTLDRDLQMANLGQKWRYNLRKSLRNDLTFREDSSADGARAFATLHAEMVARKRFGNLDRVDLVEPMLTGLPAALRPRIFLVEHRCVPIAGAVIGEFGDTAYYIYGASSDSALKLRAGYALQWGIVEILNDRGCALYDLGGTSGDEGLRQFKDGLTGKAGHRVPLPDDFDYWAGTIGYASGRALYLARDLKGRLGR